MNIKGDIVLKRGRDASARRFHPWIFSGAVHRMEGKPLDGEWVRVLDESGQTLGFGHYQKGTITVRLLHFSSEPPAEHFYLDKLRAAWRQREVTGLQNEHTNAFRLIHGEGDGLSGLIIDMYHGVAVLQAHSPGFVADRFLVSEALREVLKEKLHAVYFKDNGGSESAYLFGMASVPHVISENGHLFYVDWESGQKTGFFLDQRDNRQLIGRYARGATVLNTFCYTGGFSVYALSAGASLVHSVDASERAIELTAKNIALNGYDADLHASFAEDVFDFLQDKSDVYDLMVLDPPAFAKHRDARHQAMKGYQRLNAEAFRRIKKDGILFTFSCSQVVDRQLFYDTVVSAAIQSRREVSVLHHLSQPADHPVSMYHPEGAYLKGLVLYVR